MALACIRKSSLNFQVFYDAVDGPLGGGRIKWQFKCRAKPLCALPSFVNGGIIAAWAAVQAHLNQTATTEPLRSRGMSCRAIYQLRLSTSFAAVVTERLQRGMKSPVLDKIPNKRSVEATAVSLTPGKLSAIRAAFKAGITPTKIAKEFGLSQADVRSVIASDKSFLR